jgi:hypothetical protein
MRADQVGELRRIVDALREHLELVGQARARRDQRDELLRERARERGRLDRLLSPVSSSRRTRPTRNGCSETKSSTAARATPCTSSRYESSGNFSIFAMRITVPTRCRSSGPGLDSTGRFTATHTSSRSGLRSTSSISLPRAVGVHEQRREQVREQHRVLERQHRQRVRDRGQRGLVAADCRRRSRCRAACPCSGSLPDRRSRLHSRSTGTLRRTGLRRPSVTVNSRLRDAPSPRSRSTSTGTRRQRSNGPVAISIWCSRTAAAPLPSRSPRMRRHRPIDGHAQIAATHARELGAHDHRFLRLEHVDVGLPVIAVQPIGELAEPLRTRLSPV